MLECPLCLPSPPPHGAAPVHGDCTLHTSDRALTVSSCSRLFKERSQRSVMNVPRIKTESLVDFPNSVRPNCVPSIR